MRFEHADIIDAPKERVFAIMRDELPQVAAYLPNISKVQTLEYTKEGSKTAITNHWFAEASVPAMAEKFVKPELFSWKDTALWDDEQFQVSYELESFLSSEIYDAKGVNYFRDTGDGKTELQLTCEVVIHADKIPGVPRLLSRKVVPMVEKMIEKMLAPNLTSLGEGLKKYLKDH